MNLVMSAFEIKRPSDKQAGFLSVDILGPVTSNLCSSPVVCFFSCLHVHLLATHLAVNITLGKSTCG